MKAKKISSFLRLLCFLSPPLFVSLTYFLKNRSPLPNCLEISPCFKRRISIKKCINDNVYVLCMCMYYIRKICMCIHLKLYAIILYSSCVLSLENFDAFECFYCCWPCLIWFFVKTFQARTLGKSYDKIK